MRLYKNRIASTSHFYSTGRRFARKVKAEEKKMKLFLAILIVIVAVAVADGKKDDEMWKSYKVTQLNGPMISLYN